MADFIDPDELPFTTAEIYEAGQRFLPEPSARDMADHLTHIGPSLIEHRARRRAEWRRHGIPNADMQPLHGWVYPDELLSALASLGQDVRARALRLIDANWESSYQSDLRNHQLEAAERAGIVPSSEQVRRLVEHAEQSEKEGGQLFNALAIKHPPLLAPTQEMVSAAEERRAEKRRRFEALVVQLRR
jgi:hypothetical protein